MLTQALDAAAEADLVEADLRVAMLWVFWFLGV